MGPQMWPYQAEIDYRREQITADYARGRRKATGRTAAARRSWPTWQALHLVRRHPRST